MTRSYKQTRLLILLIAVALVVSPLTVGYQYYRVARVRRIIPRLTAQLESQRATYISLIHELKRRHKPIPPPVIHKDVDDDE